MKEARAVWQGGLAFEATAGSGFQTRMDSSAPLGQETGFRPVEMLLVGLAGCTGMDVISILQKKRQRVTGFVVAVTGTQTEEYPHIFTDIMVHYTVRGWQVDPQAVARSIELSATKYCPVWAMLAATARIQSKFTIEEELTGAA